MAKEILLYSPLYSSTVADFINQMEAAKGQDVTCRVYSPGGDVYAAYGAIAKWNEHTNGKKLKIDGRADSSSAYMMCCIPAADVQSLDVSKFLFHRAAYPQWVENDKEAFTDERKASLNSVNKKLRGFIESKTTAEKWFAVTGISLDAMFSLDARIDVEINATQAQALGFVGKIVPLTPHAKNEIQSLAASHGIAALADTISKNKNSDNMEAVTIKTLADLEAQYPELFKEALKKGATLEAKRIKGWNAWAHVDAEAVKKGIESGESITSEDISEFSVKAMSPEVLEKMRKANKTVNTGGNATETTAGNKSPEQIRMEQFRANATAQREGKELPHSELN